MVDVYFGLPGSGKTTLAARIASKALKEGRKVYTDFSVCALKGCTHFDMATLGTVTPPRDSLLIVDEASIQYNNRNFKSLPHYVIKWFKLHRHYGVDIVVFSQSWDDMDITLRRLASRLWHIRRCGPFSFVRRIKKTIGIDKNTHQIIDKYAFCSILSKFLRLPLFKQLFMPVTPWYFLIRPVYYDMFDSWSAPQLPVAQ